GRLPRPAPVVPAHAWDLRQLSRPGLEPGHPPTRPPPDLRGADMFPQPAERRHTIQVRVPLTGVKGADVVEMLDGLLRFPQELRVTYEFAERWVDGKHQTAARETWTIVARTHLLPGQGGEVKLTQDDYKGAGGRAGTPDSVRALIRHYRPSL